MEYPVAHYYSDTVTHVRKNTALFASQITLSSGLGRCIEQLENLVKIGEESERHVKEYDFDCPPQVMATNALRKSHQ